jgi:hypothetical protein
LASLPNGEDWLMLPVLEGLCRFESLKDGTLDLADVALMNDALLIRAENKARIYQGEERQHG